MGLGQRALHGNDVVPTALDLGLQKAPGLPPGAHGEEWQVHGGGFYHITKYLVAPERLPEHLTWFKWESYSTWLSGVAMLGVLYWAQSELFLIDPAKMALLPWQAILISAGFFFAAIGRERTTPNPFIALVWLGAASLTAGVLTLGIGLLVA